MIKFENAEVVGWKHAIRGMRNPKNSWDRSDSYSTYIENADTLETAEFEYFVGEKDHKLMMNLANGGSVHAKYRRMITVYVDVVAPLYWWKEFDTYKVGTVANSCSTMHKIADKEFVLEDFSFERMDEVFTDTTKRIISDLNLARDMFHVTKEKAFWDTMIQMLPSSYNQRRTLMLNYEVLAGIYESRKSHKLDEWTDFCNWIEQLPYSEIITGGQKEC